MVESECCRAESRSAANHDAGGGSECFERGSRPEATETGGTELAPGARASGRRYVLFSRDWCAADGARGVTTERRLGGRLCTRVYLGLGGRQGMREGGGGRGLGHRSGVGGM